MHQICAVLSLVKSLQAACHSRRLFLCQYMAERSPVSMHFLGDKIGKDRRVLADRQEGVVWQYIVAYLSVYVYFMGWQILQGLCRRLYP